MGLGGFTVDPLLNTKMKQNLYAIRLRAFLKYEKTCEKLKKTPFFTWKINYILFSVKESQCQPLELGVVL